MSTGACIGHVGPEALAGGPIGKIEDGDILKLVVDRNQLTGSVDYVGRDPDRLLSPDEGATELGSRPAAKLSADKKLPADTRLWAALQSLGGGTWGGCVYDPDAIEAALRSATHGSDK